jgi:hypothetical protein
MICLVIGLGDRRLLPVIDHFRGGLFRHLCSSHVGRRRYHWNIDLRLRITLTLVNDGLVSNVRDMISLTSRGVGNGSDATSSK